MLEIYHIKKTNRKPPFVNASAPKFERKKLLLFLKSLRISAIAKIFYAKCTKKTEFLLIYFALFGVLK